MPTYTPNFNLAKPLVGDATDENQWGTELNTDLDIIDASLQGPAGMVVMYASSTVPARFLECNGALVSRTTYAGLFAVIGTNFGVGDGSTTFALPDLRGEFIRGWDDNRGIDAGRVFGSSQKGSQIAGDYSNIGISAVTPFNGSSTDPNDFRNAFGYDPHDPSLSSITSEITGAVSKESPQSFGTVRPRNIALMYIIKT